MKHINPIFVIDSIVFVYRVFGRETAKRMITIPRGWCVSRARANGEDPAQLIAKRDAWTEATLELAEEILNVDQD